VKNTNVPTRNRTRDLPACSAVPQPTAMSPTIFPSVNPLKMSYTFLASTLPAYYRPASLIIFKVHLLVVL
jgi:hypothetical protein